MVHQLRGRMDGILVGVGTAQTDDPLLTARPAGPRIAVRIVLDSHAILSTESQLVRTVSQAPVLVVATHDAPESRCEALRQKGVEIVILSADAQGRVDLISLSKELGRRHLTNVLIEGGSQVLGSFFDAGLLDEVHAFIAPKLLGGSLAITPIAGQGLDIVPVSSILKDPLIEVIDGDIYVHGRVSSPIDSMSSSN